MAAKDRNPRSGGGLNSIAPTHNLDKVGSITVTFMAVSAVEFGPFVDRIHNQIDVVLHAQGADLDVSREELSRYFVTAIATRIAHVNSRRFHIRVNDKWALPLPMAYAVAALGRIELPSGLEVIPEVDENALAFALSTAEFEDLTNRLRAIESLGLRFAHALESNQLGDEKVMMIIPIVTNTGSVLYTSQDPITGIHAMTSAVMGSNPVELPNGIPIPWLPDYVIHDARLVQFRGRYADLNEAQSRD